MGASGIELLKRQDALAASVDVPFDVARPATDRLVPVAFVIDASAK